MRVEILKILYVHAQPSRSETNPPCDQDTLWESGKFMGSGWMAHFSVDIVTLVPLYIVGRHSEAQFLGLIKQTAFREKKLPEADAPSCAASGDFLQHTRQRPCYFGKAVFLCAGAGFLRRSIGFQGAWCSAGVQIFTR